MKPSSFWLDGREKSAANSPKIQYKMKSNIQSAEIAHSQEQNDNTTDFAEDWQKNTGEARAK